MQINSVNSPAFGCGACAALKKISTGRAGKNADTYYKAIQDVVKDVQKEDKLTHGQAASKVLKNVKKSINREA